MSRPKVDPLAVVSVLIVVAAVLLSFGAIAHLFAILAARS